MLTKRLFCAALLFQKNLNVFCFVKFSVAFYTKVINVIPLTYIPNLQLIRSSTQPVGMYLPYPNMP